MIAARRARPGRSRWRAIEPFSCYSHLVGVLLAISGLVVLLGLSRDDPWRLVAFSIYGASLIQLYLASTVYHWLLLPIAQRKWLNRIDHVAIFLLIAGTYTPVCLVTLRGGWGWSRGLEGAGTGRDATGITPAERVPGVRGAPRLVDPCFG